MNAALEAIIPLRFILLNSGMIPSTLKVTLELIKIAYTTFIHFDEHLYDSSKNMKYRYDKNKDKSRIGCNSLALCETLGNIRYMFTDKTGTLTNNELFLRELHTDDRVYFLKSLFSLMSLMLFML